MTEVVTIGLGYIGLPTATLIANNNINVIGVDIDENVVNTINKGEIHIIEPDLDIAVKNAVNKGYLRAATEAVQANIYIIVVPTPFKGNYEPDISYIEAATKSILSLLKENDLYIIESTSPVGTTEKMKNLIFNERPELKNKINIAYCPERVLPGNVMYELVYNDRVIGGVDEKSTIRAINFYKQFVKGELYPTNAQTAEMCKLTENASRDVQIAFANELSIICEKENIDVWELINLANKHPRVNILNPGCGVGGHCIAVDPYFITNKHPQETKIISTARNVNSNKPKWVVNKIINEIKQFKLNFNHNPIIGLLGLSFKPNIDDLRESPAMEIANTLKNNYNFDIMYVEPNIKHHKKFMLSELNNTIEKSDIIVCLVGHKEFKVLNNIENKLILDFCGILN